MGQCVRGSEWVGEWVSEWGWWRFEFRVLEFWSSFECSFLPSFIHSLTHTHTHSFNHNSPAQTKSKIEKWKMKNRKVNEKLRHCDMRHWHWQTTSQLLLTLHFTSFPTHSFTDHKVKYCPPLQFCNSGNSPVLCFSVRLSQKWQKSKVKTTIMQLYSYIYIKTSHRALWWQSAGESGEWVTGGTGASELRSKAAQTDNSESISIFGTFL